MKKYLILLLIAIIAPILSAQESDENILAKINNNQQVTATTKSAARLFADKDDLTSVIYILPIGSVVEVIGLDSAYYNVLSGEDKGYIKKNQVAIDAIPKTTDQSATSTSSSYSVENVQSYSAPAEIQSTSTSRLTNLQAKYDPKTAKSIFERKIWKGMNTDMVIDSWGNPQKINRTIIPDSVTEEWSYTSTWLYFEDDILVSWGPIEK
jgi:hypothetical protein